MGSISESEINSPTTASTTTKIPIIDLSPFTSPSPSQPASPDARLQAAQALVRACREVGFVYIKNHGVSQAELDQAFALSKQFYGLPMEEKMKAPHPLGWAVHRGYSWPGLEKVSGALSEREDEEWVGRLREVEDYKVCLLSRGDGVGDLGRMGSCVRDAQSGMLSLPCVEEDHSGLMGASVLHTKACRNWVPTREPALSSPLIIPNSASLPY